MNWSKLWVGTFIYLFLASAFFDLLFSLMVLIKQPIFNESNPIYVLTGNFFLFAIVKIVIVTLVYLYFKKWYFKTNQLFRYGMVILLLVGILGQVLGAVSGLEEFKKEPEAIVPVPDDVKLEQYQENNAPKAFFILFAFMLLTFWLYMNFEEND